MLNRLWAAGLALLTLGLAGGVFAETPAESAAPAGARALGEQVETLKLESVDLARSVLLLEDGLGSPEQRLVVFVSVDSALSDRPEHVELRLGDDTVAEHDYPSAESTALQKGGAHRLYAASLEPGRHVLEARVTARGPAGRTCQTAKLSFRSGDAPKTIELRLQATREGTSELTVQEWD